MKTFIAIVVTVSMKGSPNYKIQFVNEKCDIPYATKMAENITKRAFGVVKSVECIKLKRK